jgi:hypothetical protein
MVAKAMIKLFSRVWLSVSGASGVQTCASRFIEVQNGRRTTQSPFPKLPLYHKRTSKNNQAKKIYVYRFTADETVWAYTHRNV